MKTLMNQGNCSLLLFLLLVLCNSCERRPLEDEYVDMARLQVAIDWSRSGIPKDGGGKYGIHRATLLFYPQSGGEALEYYLEEDIFHREIEIPVGVYSVLVFNETPDESDWTSIYFTGVESYQTFAAHVKTETQKGLYTRTTENNLCKQPDPLAAWSLERFEVTQDMVEETRQAASGRTVSSQIHALTGIQPLPRSQRVLIKARVVNLSSAIQATGLVKGVVTGVMMASGECINEYASHAVLLNGRQMEANGKDGTIGATMYMFGQKPNETYEFQTDFVLNDGTLYTPPSINSPNLFTSDKDDNGVDYVIDVGIGSSTIPTPDNPTPDPDIPPIALPESETNAEVEVGNWDEVIIPMN